MLIRGVNTMQNLNITNIDEIIGEPISVLDKGFIRVIDYMGGDDAIVQAARVSYGKGTKQSNQDAGLIDYLMRNDHTSPFEMCEIKMHVKMPIFIARQWLRHRTASVNEYSARYSVLNDEFYLPAVDRVCEQSSTNKQCSGDAFSQTEAENVIAIIEESSKHSLEQYKKLLELGVAREIARSIVPLNTYTELYWKIDLHNLLRFIKLRNSDHAQYEIRVYAQAMQEVLRVWVPNVYESFMRHKMS